MKAVADHFIRNEGAHCADPYEYKESGLQGIFLHNGFEVIEREGESYVSVYDTDGLHHAIGVHIVRNRKELAPEEFGFLRKIMDLTQSELGRWMGQSSQQIARWEKGQSEIPGPADRLLRAIFMLQTMGPGERENFLNVLKNIEEMDALTPRRIQLYLNGDEWGDRKASAA